MPNTVKNTTIINPLDLIAPHSCRGCGYTSNALCERCKKYILKIQHNTCPMCKEDNPTGNCHNCLELPPTFIGGERSGLLGNIVHEYKYNSVRALSRPLAEIMSHALPPTLSAHNPYIVPLPTIPKHIRSRGFDHTLLLAKRLSKLTGYPVKRLFVRVKNTVQVGADRKTREHQAKNAYQLIDDSPNPNFTYILLDDVWTTGASMQACTEKLRQAGVNHIILAILALSRID